MARRSKTEWVELVNAFEKSSMTQAEFVAKHGVNIGTFQQWLYRTRKEKRLASSIPTFIDITSSLPITVRFRGIEISFETAPSAEWLAELASHT